MMPGPGGDTSAPAGGAPSGRDDAPQGQAGPQAGATPSTKDLPKEPVNLVVTFNKVKGSLGLSIVAAKVSHI